MRDAGPAGAGGGSGAVGGSSGGPPFRRARAEASVASASAPAPPVVAVSSSSACWQRGQASTWAARGWASAPCPGCRSQRSSWAGVGHSCMAGPRLLPRVQVADLLLEHLLHALLGHVDLR